MELSRALEIGHSLMREHGLIAQGWCLKVDRLATRRPGQCRPGPREIGLTKSYVELNEEREIRSTMLHEIAHALVGCHHGHDEVWKAKARELGDDGERCSRTAKVPPARFIGRCGAGCVFPRNLRRRGRLTCRPHGRELVWERGDGHKHKPLAGRPVWDVVEDRAKLYKGKYPHFVEFKFNFNLNERRAVIKCTKCGALRECKPQDVFQVKLCLACKTK